MRQNIIPLPKLKARPSYRLYTLIAFLSFLFIVSSTSTVEASHYRYGQITWTPDPAVPGKIDFTVNTAWRGGSAAIGSTQSRIGRFYFGNGSSTFSTQGVVVSNNAAENWFFMTSTFSYTYTSSGNFTAYFGSCCRIGGMQNGSNANYRGETIVNIDLANWASNNKPPNSSLPAIVAIQQGTGVANFIVPGFDPDGDNLSYRLANSSEIGISNPSGLSIDSNTGLISFTPPSGGFTFNHLYAAGVTIEDGKSKTIVDFIIKVVGTSMPPTFDYSSTPANNFAYTLSPGDNINFTVDADDPDSGSTVFLLATGQPSSGTFTPALPTSPSSGNSSTTFDWSPGISDLGSYVITFTATDNLGVQSLTSVVINVTSAPVLDSPPSLGDQSLLCLETGAYSQTLQFSDADVNDAVSIVSANFLSTLPATIPTPPSTPGGGFPVVGSLPPGLSFSTALPTTAANPTSTDLSGFISASDWGIYNLEITAEDGFGEQTSLNNYYIVNEDPYFTTPVPAGETAYVGQSYTLVISASDNDIAYGDAVAFADPGKSYVMIPSWMTATADGNGNLTLSGTPSATDAGTHSLQIELHDRTTHFQHFHCSWQFQNFDIEVLTCNSPVAACNDITVSFDGNSSVQITAADIDAGSTADCGVAELTASPTEFYCADYIGENVTVSNANVTLTMEDINGEISSCISVVSVVHDDDSPVYDECPSDVTVDNDMALCGAIQNYNVTASDACSNVTLIQTEGLTSGSLFPVGVTTNTFEASDEDNNVSVCSFTVTVLDNEAPIALCQDITVELGALGAGTVSDSEISGVINTYASVTGLGTDNVTVTSAGGFGNGDKVIVMQMNGADINQSNSASFGDVTAINNAGNYEYARIKSVSGNTIEFLTDLERAYDVSATIQLIRVPEYDNVLVTGTLTAADWNGSTGGVLAFDAEGTVTMNAGIDMDGKGYRGGLRSNNYFPGCPNITNYFLYSPTGQSGDKGEGIADLGSAYKAGRGRLVNGGGGATSINSGGGGGANIGAGGHGGREWIGCNQPLGGLGGASVAAYNSSNKVFLGGAGGGGQQNNSAGTNGADGGGMVFITAEEIIGNGNTISANGNNALHANNDGAGGGGAGGSVLINATSLSSGLTVSVAGGYGGNALFDHGPAGGGGGGLFWHSGASLPESISVNTSGGARGLAGGNNRGSADGLAGGTLGGLEFPGVTSISAATILITDIDAGSTDNCDIASIELTQTEYDCGDLGEVVVTMTVDDINANSSSCNATVTVVEYNVPDLTCPASIMVDNDLGQCSAIVQFAATASDDCDDSVALTYSSNSGDSYPLGESTISVTATDDSENESTCTFTIVVSDNEDPAITCPSDINVFATSAAGTVVTYLTPVGTDNCSSTTTLDLGFASGDVFPLGTTSNIYTAEDATGNSVSCGFDVTVTGIAPDVICPDDLLVSTDNGSCDAVVTYSASESTAIPAAIITYSITPGSVFQLGSTEVTATATNAIGNDACTFTVT